MTYLDISHGNKLCLYFVYNEMLLVCFPFLVNHLNVFYWVNYTTKKTVWSSCNFTYLFCLTIDFIKTEKRIMWQGIRDVSKMDSVTYWTASCVSVVKKFWWYNRIKKYEMSDTWSIYKRRWMRNHFWLEDLILTKKSLSVDCRKPWNFIKKARRTKI